jgi:hypothetical protein
MHCSDILALQLVPRVSVAFLWRCSGVALAFSLAFSLAFALTLRVARVLHHHYHAHQTQVRSWHFSKHHCIDTPFVCEELLVVLLWHFSH